jgi:glycosyltransferase involved in cell wall biosynthesis
VVRVLAITNWYPPQHYGGYELVCFDAMVGMADRGHDVHVLCSDAVVGDDRVSRRPEHEARVRRTLRLYHDGDQLLRPTWRDRLSIERHNQAALRQALDEVRPDVVSVWHMAAVSHGLLNTLVATGTPLVFSIYDDWLTFGLGLDPWAAPFNRSTARRCLGRLVERLTGVPCVVADIGDAGVFLFTTRATESTALARSRWKPRRRAIVWGGVDREVFHPGSDPRLGWSWRLVVTGRFDPRKGFETAVRALALLPPESTLAVWGRGGYEERARLEGIAEELGVRDRVRFGTLDREQLADEYRGADVMVFPSIWAEPFGLVPIEAMACGTPVVATGVGGSSEFLVDEQNCLVFVPEDHVALAAAVERLARDEQLRRTVTAGGAATAAAFDIDRFVDVMEAWHVHQAGGGTDPPPPDQNLIPIRPE